MKDHWSSCIERCGNPQSLSWTSHHSLSHARALLALGNADEKRVSTAMQQAKQFMQQDKRRRGYEYQQREGQEDHDGESVAWSERKDIVVEDAYRNRMRTFVLGKRIAKAMVYVHAWM